MVVLRLAGLRLSSPASKSLVFTDRESQVSKEWILESLRQMSHLHAALSGIAKLSPYCGWVHLQKYLMIKKLYWICVCQNGWKICLRGVRKRGRREIKKDYIFRSVLFMKPGSRNHENMEWVLCVWNQDGEYNNNNNNFFLQCWPWTKVLTHSRQVSHDWTISLALGCISDYTLQLGKKKEAWKQPHHTVYLIFLGGLDLKGLKRHLISLSA